MQEAATSMALVVTSFIASVVGFVVCFFTIRRMRTPLNSYAMRICMMNNMSLAFVFAMLIELTTGSKSLAVVVPITTVCLPLLWAERPLQYLEMVELLISSIMSVSMSVMLIGMLPNQVVWLIQLCLLTIEVLLYLAARRVA